MKRKLLFIAVLAAGTVFGSYAAKPGVIAHRGYWDVPTSAQNSIRSLIKADSIKAFGSEFDVWYTADKKLVVNHVVVATVGTKLYDGDKEFAIKKSKIRGVESFGMICAEDEIGVGNSHAKRYYRTSYQEGYRQGFRRLQGNRI